VANLNARNHLRAFFVILRKETVLSERPRPVTIGVAGGTGSGKTTISNALLERVGEQNIAYLPHDNYYKDITSTPLHSHAIRNFDHPDALDTHLLINNIKELQNLFGNSGNQDNGGGLPVGCPYNITKHRT
jgi:Ni2+-binding GTPase involved in maturation of urease and hydrogenase